MAKLIWNAFLPAKGIDPTPGQQTPEPTLDPQWTLGTIGTPPTTPTAVTVSGQLRINGTGDINSTADSGGFVYKTLSGDGEVIAKVVSLTGEDLFASACLMLRDSLDPGAVYALADIDLRPQGGPRAQFRLTANDNDVHDDIAQAIAPAGLILRLSRSGNVVTAFYSDDGGINERTIGSRTVPFTGTDILAGFAVATSAGTPAQAVFENFAVNGITALAGKASFTTASQQIDEDGGSIVVTVQRTGGISGAGSAVVNRNAGSTAVAGLDYTDPGFPKTLNWSDGDGAAKTITIPILNRAGVQANRQLIVEITSATQISIDLPFQQTIDIIDTAPNEDPIITEGLTNFFVDSNAGNDSWNGKYASFKGGSNGPWQSIDHADAHSYASTDNLFLKCGSIWTGQRLFNNTMQGTSSRKFVLGAYYIDGGGVVRRGVSGNKPILRGTSTYGHKGDGSGALPVGSLFPGEFEGLVTFQGQNYRIENIKTMYSGGHGIQCQGASRSNPTRFYEVVNCDTELTYQGGVHNRFSADFLVEGCTVTGAASKEGIYDLGGWGGSMVGNSASRFTMRNNMIWESWGEAILLGEGQDCTIEGNFCYDVHAVDGVYLDTMQNAIIRRNLIVKTDRQRWWRSPGTTRSFGAIVVNNEKYHFAVNGGPLANDHVTRDVVAYANIIAGSGTSFSVGSSYVHPDAQRDVYFYNNLSIDPGQHFGATTNTWANGRFWNNVCVRGGGTLMTNPFNSRLDGHDSATLINPSGDKVSTISWNNADIGGVLTQEGTFWNDVHNLVPNTTQDGTTRENALALRTILEARAQLVAGSGWESTGVAISSLTFPPNVTQEAGPADTDYFGNPFTHADRGPFAS